MMTDRERRASQKHLKRRIKKIIRRSPSPEVAARKIISALELQQEWRIESGWVEFVRVVGGWKNMDDTHAEYR